MEDNVIEVLSPDFIAVVRPAQLQLLSLVGSRLSGLNHSKSDYDFYGIYQRDIRHYITFNQREYTGGRYSTIYKNREISVAWLDLHRFLYFVQKSNVTAYEIIAGMRRVYHPALLSIDETFFSSRTLYYQYARTALGHLKKHEGSTLYSTKRMGYIVYNYVMSRYFLENNIMFPTLNTLYRYLPDNVREECKALICAIQHQKEYNLSQNISQWLSYQVHSYGTQETNHLHTTSRRFVLEEINSEMLLGDLQNNRCS